MQQNNNLVNCHDEIKSYNVFVALLSCVSVYVVVYVRVIVRSVRESQGCQGASFFSLSQLVVAVIFPNVVLRVAHSYRFIQRCCVVVFGSKKMEELKMKRKVEGGLVMLFCEIGIFFPLKICSCLVDVVVIMLYFRIGFFADRTEPTQVKSSEEECRLRKRWNVAHLYRFSGHKIQLFSSTTTTFLFFSPTTYLLFSSSTTITTTATTFL